MDTFFILVTEYGRRELTKACIQSIPRHKMRGENNRVIVLDDGYYKDQMYDLFDSESIAVYSPEENLGFAGNVNRGFQEMVSGLNYLYYDRIVKPNYDFMVSNNDILFDCDTISKMRSALAVHNGEAIIGPTIRLPQSYFQKGVKSTHPQLISEEDQEPLATKFIYTTAISGACFITSSQVWKRLGGFDSENFRSYFEDDDLCVRANREGIPVAVYTGATISHLAAQTMSRSESKYNEQFEKSKETFKNKYPELTWDSSGTYPYEVVL